MTGAAGRGSVGIYRLIAFTSCLVLGIAFAALGSVTWLGWRATLVSGNPDGRRR